MPLCTMPNWLQGHIDHLDTLVHNGHLDPTEDQRRQIEWDLIHLAAYAVLWLESMREG